MADTYVVLAVLAAVLAVLAAATLRRPVHEGFAALKASAPEELRGRRVAVVRSLPDRRDRTTVYLVVDEAGRLRKNPRLPLEGTRLEDVMREMQTRFGERFVEATTARPARAGGKVRVVYDAQSRLVTRVLVPRQWAMPPRTLRLRGVTVALNPPAGAALQRPTLVLTASAAGVVGSATLR